MAPIRQFCRSKMWELFSRSFKISDGPSIQVRKQFIQMDSVVS